MDKKIISTVIIVSLFILILGWILIDSVDKKNQKNLKLPSKNSVVFYYGITCPHCREVEEWMKKNKIEEKIKIEKKEVYQNKKNALELEKVAENCGLKTDSIGVPFLYADGKCFIGTPAVINKLEEKLKFQNQNAK